MEFCCNYYAWFDVSEQGLSDNLLLQEIAATCLQDKLKLVLGL